jgi:hypothetical protein
MTLHPIHSEFPNINEENFLFFFISVERTRALYTVTTQKLSSSSNEAQVLPSEKGRGAFCESTGSYLSLVLLGRGVEKLEWMGKTE